MPVSRIWIVLFAVVIVFPACDDDCDLTYERQPSGSEGDGDSEGDAPVDCLGVVGGDAVVDGCGVCEGDGSTCDCSVDSYCDQMILAHNGVRQGINDGSYFDQPIPDTPLPDVTWDPLLAQVAFGYASLCEWGHNADRASEYAALGGSGSVGENIAASTNERTPENVVLNQWADEVQYYDYASNSCSDVCGHYTQVVWANTTRIGCATVYCPLIEGWQEGWYTVCNYAPPGNYNNQRPY